MNRLNKILSIVLTFILLNSIFSCAGLQSKREAQDEFDRGLSLFNRGNYEEAITHFTRATDIEPEFGRAYLYLGRSYLNLGKWKEAFPPLRTAFRLSPEESREEITDIIMDYLFLNSSKLDDTGTDMLFQFEDFLKGK